MEVDTECRNYRLRLGLPELSQPFFGSWLSPDSPSPPPSFFFDSFPPSQSSSAPPCPPPPHFSSNGSHDSFATESLPLRSQEKDRIHVPDDFQKNEGEVEGQELECRSGIDLSNLWLDAGRFSDGQPSQQDWEVTHMREEMLGARSSAAISGKFEFGSKTRDLVPKYSIAEKGESRATHFIFDSIQNSFVGDSGRKKRKRQNFMTERNSEHHLDTSSEIWEELGGFNISPHCHTNQAFAVAVKTFMQGNLASLDKIRSSVNHQRQIALSGRNVHLSEVVNGEAGLVFGFGCGDVTLLELFLHSHKQRELLQALAAVCRINEGDSLVRLSGDDSVDSTGIRILTEDVNIKRSPIEMETHLFSASRNAFKEFPRGADLLSYLFDKLSVADTLHLELIRFLFERACQPYMVFIRSWLYLATVQDPFGEFFVKAVPSTDLKKSPGKTREQDALLSYQIPKGVTVPCFLVEVFTPLLRAGQQLQVLSKLLDTPSASKIVDSPFQSSGSIKDTQLSFLRSSDTLINKSTLDGAQWYQQRLQLWLSHNLLGYSGWSTGSTYQRRTSNFSFFRVEEMPDH